MALRVETFEIEAQTPNVVDQETSVLRKATPILLGASCLAALALFHTGGSAAGSSQGSQQLVVAEHPFGNEGSVRIHVPHGNEGSVRINGMRPSDVNGVIDDAHGVPHMFGIERDEHGCLPTGGFVWCASRGECLQPWRTQCAASVMHAGAQVGALGVPVIDNAHGVPHMFGTERDEHGCLPTGGFVWCASRGECLQPWRTQCADLSASVNEIAQEVGSWDTARHSGTPHHTPHGNEGSVRSDTPHGNEGSVHHDICGNDGTQADFGCPVARCASPEPGCRYVRDLRIDESGLCCPKLCNSVC